MQHSPKPRSGVGTSPLPEERLGVPLGRDAPSDEHSTQIVSEALCRNNRSGFGTVCAGVCESCTIPSQPHPCEHALTVWGSDAQEVLRGLGGTSPKDKAASEMLAALEAVVRVADRKTVEFDAAHAAIAAAKAAGIKAADFLEER